MVSATGAPRNNAPNTLKIAPSTTEARREKAPAATPGAIISSLVPAANATAKANERANKKKRSSITTYPHFPYLTVIT